MRNIRIMASGRYQVELQRGVKRITLGTFDTAIEAKRIRDDFLEKERATGKYPRNNQYTVRAMELQPSNRP